MVLLGLAKPYGTFTIPVPLAISVSLPLPFPFTLALNKFAHVQFGAISP